MHVKKKYMVARGWSEGAIEKSMFSGCRVSIWDDKKYLEMDSGADCATLGMHFIPQNCTLKCG